MKKADLSSTMNSIPKPDFIEENEKSNDLLASSSNQSVENNPSIGTKHDPDEIWKIVKEHLRMHVSPRDMNIWYEGVYIESISNGVVILSCDNSVKRDWIESYNRSFIRNKIEEVIGYKPDLMITIRSGVKKSTTEAEDPNSKYAYYDPQNTINQQELFGASSAGIDQGQSLDGAIERSNLNPRYLLSNFVVGNSNQLAHAVAESASQNPGVAYNPIFFYGPSGVGKTHLMQGIGNAVLEQNPQAKVLYVPIESFMNEMIEAIKSNKNEDFRKKYRPADVLIIDDIQFVSTYTKTKEELFNTFNALYETNKQIVIASDRAPHEIDNLPDRLKTRFQGGMVVDIHSPDLETRIAILRQEANQNQMEIPADLIMFIAQNVENNVRELQGAMTKVITLSKINGDLPSVENVAKMLQVDIDSKRKRVTPDDVIQSVADVFEVTKKEIIGKRRTAYIATARQVVMYLLREELELPLEKVAQSVNRKDHTTVLHACDKIEGLLQDNPRMRERVLECRTVFSA